MTQLPVTLTTAMILALVAAAISVRAVLTRKPNAIANSLGTQRTSLQSERLPRYVEYLPVLLLLMRLLETAGASHALLGTASATLVAARILHGIGVARLAPQFCNIAGVIGATMLVVLCACYGFVIDG